MQRVTLKDLEKIATAPQKGHPQVTVGAEDWDRIRETIRYYDNMSSDTFSAPNLANATPSFIADEFGAIKEEIKPRQTYENILKNWLKDNRPESNMIEGEHYNVVFKWVSKMIMDSAAVAEYVKDPDAFIVANVAPTETLSMKHFMKPSEYWEARASKRG